MIITLNSQGFATGDLDDDAWALRHFVSRGTLEIAAAQSFSKNMGLYGERVGAFHLLTGSPDAAARAKGHLARLQRGQISQPPTRGSKLATTILTNPALSQEWLIDLQKMSSRIKNMRKALYEELLSLRTPGNWEHVVLQVSRFMRVTMQSTAVPNMIEIGMFSYTGLSPEQVVTVQADSHVFILKSGRISVAGCKLS